MNFDGAAVAQGLLEVVKQKMENAMDQSKQCSNKRTELDESTPNRSLPRGERKVTDCERLVILTKILQNKSIDEWDVEI